MRKSEDIYGDNTTVGSCAKYKQSSYISTFLVRIKEMANFVFAVD